MIGEAAAAAFAAVVAGAAVFWAYMWYCMYRIEQKKLAIRKD